MIGPEPHQTFAEWCGRGDGACHRRQTLLLIQRAGPGLAGRRLVLAVLPQRGEAIRQRWLRAGGGAGGIGLAKLIEQPGGWVGGRCFGAGRAHPEADQSVRGSKVHGGRIQRNNMSKDHKE